MCGLPYFPTLVCSLSTRRVWLFITRLQSLKAIRECWKKLGIKALKMRWGGDSYQLDGSSVLELRSSTWSMISNHFTHIQLKPYTVASSTICRNARCYSDVSQITFHFKLAHYTNWTISWHLQNNKCLQKNKTI